MSDPAKPPVHIPSRDELQDAVLPRCTDADIVGPPVPRSSPAAAPPGAGLSPGAHALLLRAAHPESADQCLEDHWKALGVRHGSRKRAILNELRSGGFVYLESHGRKRLVRLYPRAWAYLGMDAPKGAGDGGSRHRAVVRTLARAFTRRGYETHIEQELGPGRKRCDLVCYSRDRVIGIEVGLSRAEQEVKNIRDDLASGALDQVILVSDASAILRRVRLLIEEDPELAGLRGRIRFFLLTETPEDTADG